jgi:hypothetical protein
MWFTLTEPLDLHWNMTVPFLAQWVVVELKPTLFANPQVACLEGNTETLRECEDVFLLLVSVVADID